MQKSEVNKQTYRFWIGSLGTLGYIIFDILMFVGPIGYRPNRGFHLLLHHHHPAVSRLSINSHIQAISAAPPT